MTVKDLAFEIGTVLANHEVTAVLSGGGAATFYAPEAYQTRDLDFVLPFTFTKFKAEVIISAGFKPSNSKGTYIHPDHPLTLEFIDGPLAVGDEVIQSWICHEQDGRRVNVISPTDTCRDRLAAAIHWRDLASIKQAIAVARLHTVNLDLIQRWCQAEGGEQTFKLFSQGINP